MDISGLLALLGRLESYQDLLRSLADRRLDENGSGALLNLPRFARPAVTAALHHDLGRPVAIVVARVDQAQKLAQELRAWSPSPWSVRRFPEPTPLPYDRAPWGTQSRNNRLSTLALLHFVESPLAEACRPSIPPLIVTSARALAHKTLPPKEYLDHTHRLEIGQTVRLDMMLRGWLRAGYRPATVVEEPGTFSRRGGILDICPPGADGGVRIELFGDQIESLRSFDLSTQRTRSALESIVIPPASEALPEHSPGVYAQLTGLAAGGEWSEDLVKLEEGVPFPGIEFYLPYFYPQPGTLVGHLPAGTLLLVDDWAALETELGEIERRADRVRTERRVDDPLPPGYPSPILGWEALSVLLKERGAIALGGLDARADSTGARPRAGIPDLADAFTPGPRFGGQVKPLLQHLSRLHLDGERVVIVSRQAARLVDLWRESGSAGVAASGSQSLPVPPPDGTITFVQGVLGDGFVVRGRTLEDEAGELPSTLVHLFTDSEVFGWSRPEPRQAPPRRAIAPESFFADISPGDMVVHIDHGIGRFEGLLAKQIAGHSREYLLVAYAQGDQLFVPVQQADRLSRYVGPGERLPPLHRLGGIGWSQAKARAAKVIEDMAGDLLELYAARATVRGHAFSPDTAWQAELEASFPYVETDDQLEVIAQVKRDMERAQPMDRLVCGDVGFGKTEVALRAAFKAVMDGKQVGILVPTTILAQQHYNVFRRRLAAFPIEVQMLSRFRSRSEQQRILTDLAAGKIDIVVGTHRLLQKDVTFKDQGLLIVDEEQRFGVAHKEMLKKLRTEVDVLTMTATPIPRTLYLSLTGVRDISLISTPPEERLPVQTHVGSYDTQLVRRAILRELDRGGQVFFVHNRVQTISSVARQLQQLVPEAKLSIGHGQMNERELEQVMLQFVAGDVDVLVSTSIIENGLDIPNVNTIVIDRADRFGLAQLYQLRGRVGRAARRSYAYFFHRGAALLSAESRARLETIAEHTELGSGYSIAMRDLEIRGGGEILGSSQHGHMAAIGFDLYTRLLARAVQQQRDKDSPTPVPVQLPLPDIVTVELPLESHIPEEYIPDAQFRFRLYRRMASLTSLGAVDEMAIELADRFGPIPDAVDNLLYHLRIKCVASKAGVLSIMTGDRQISIRKPGLEEMDRAALQRYLGRQVRVSRQAIWLQRDASSTVSWRVSLVQTLERLADWPG
jgi:transcription-repair coupling factor (superfamily II helicase)